MTIRTIRVALSLLTFFFAPGILADVILKNDTREVLFWENHNNFNYVYNPISDFGDWQRSDISTIEGSPNSNFSSHFNTFNVQGKHVANTNPYVPDDSRNNDLGQAASATRFHGASDWSTSYQVGGRQVEQHVLGFTFEVQDYSSFSLTGTSDGFCATYYCSLSSGLGITYSLTSLTSGEVLLTGDASNLVNELDPFGHYEFGENFFAINEFILPAGTYGFEYIVSNSGAGIILGSYAMSAQVIEYSNVPLPAALPLFLASLSVLFFGIRKSKASPR